MRALDYLPAALVTGLDDVPVDAVRVSESTRRRLESAGNQVSVVWRTMDLEGDRVIDGSVHAEALFRIECRAGSQSAAVALADDVLAVLAGHLTRVDTRYDEADDVTQQQHGVYSHVVEVGLPIDGLPEVSP